jgi:hypothetical protein
MLHHKLSLLELMMSVHVAQFHRAFAVGIELKDCSTFNSFRWTAVSLTDRLRAKSSPSVSAAPISPCQ